jgi:hypothetical protein
MTVLPIPSRRALLLVLAGLPPWIAAGCASIDPRHLTISQAELQALLDRQFPRQERVMELLDIRMSAPRVRLLPERNRIATALDLSAVERLSGQALRGGLAIEHGLRFEAGDGTLRLGLVRVDEVRLELGGTPLSGQAARIGALLAERALDDFVVYRVGDERRRLLAQAGVNNADIAITTRGVEVRFVTGR